MEDNVNETGKVLRMKKMLIFNTALAPYMIDQYNDLNKLYEVKVVFLNANVTYDKFDQHKLLGQLDCRYSYLLKGLAHKDRVFRFGVYRTIRSFNPDFIISYEYSFTTQYLLLLKKVRLIKQKIGSTIDDSLEICNNVQSKVRLFARKFAVNRLDFLVVLSEEVSKFYQNTFQLSEDRIIISPILQNPDRLRANGEELESIASIYLDEYNLKGKKILLYVGRFVEAKGLVEFINTIHKILIERENTVLVLVGAGEEKQKIELEIDSKLLQTKVLMPGRFEGDALYAWYVCASGFVLPSVYEPYGAVVNEALIFGSRVFCSKYAGAASLIGSDSSGIVFNPSNTDETVDKFQAFLNSLQIVDKIDLKGRLSLMMDTYIDFVNEWKKIDIH